MDKSNHTTPNAQTGDAARNATEQGTQPVLRPWQKPLFERIPLNEALSGAGITEDAGLNPS
jgi:hypothetical protein